MRIALVNPGGPGALRKENLGLAYLASSLSAHGHTTRIVDEIAGQQVDTALDAFRPDIVGVSAMTMFANRAYAIADRVRGERGVPVVLGGVHPTALPEEALRHADCVMRGEAELTFPRLIAEDALAGIVEAEPPDDLDALPVPDRSQLDLGFYASARDGFAGYSYRNLGIITSRGCAFACNFCLNSKRRRPLRMHSVDRVLDEIRYLAREHRIESIAFLDELAAANRERWEAICLGMIDENLNRLRWECQMHTSRIDTDLLRLMKRAGCVQVGVGFESGSQRLLDQMGKTTTVEANLEAARRVHEAGLRIRGCFIVGTPGETPRDVEETRRFIDRANIDFVSINYMTPFPGTALFDRYAARVAGSGTSWDHFTTGDSRVVACNDAMEESTQRRLFEHLRAQYAYRNYSWLEMARRVVKNPRYALLIASRLLRKG